MPKRLWTGRKQDNVPEAAHRVLDAEQPFHLDTHHLLLDRNDHDILLRLRFHSVRYFQAHLPRSTEFWVLTRSFAFKFQRHTYHQSLRPRALLCPVDRNNVLLWNYFSSRFDLVDNSSCVGVLKITGFHGYRFSDQANCGIVRSFEIWRELELDRLPVGSVHQNQSPLPHLQQQY